MGKKTGENRGRRPKHWADRAKMIYWLHDVLSRGVPDFAYLNIEFSWRIEPVRLPRGRPCAITEKRLLGADDKLPNERPRTFELIRDEQREPVSTNKKRGMAEMVDHMEGYPRFQGTKDVYESDLWILLKECEVPIDRHVQVVKALFEKYDIVQSNYKEIYQPDPRGQKIYPQTNAYWRLLVESMNSMEPVDCLTCHWHMHLRQLQDQNDFYKLRTQAEARLKQFANVYLGKLGADIFERAHQALMCSRLLFFSDEQKQSYVDLWADRSPYIRKDRIGTVQGVSGFGLGLDMLMNSAW